MKDTITIYWSPSAFLPEESSWTMLYSEPEPLLNQIIQKKNDNNKKNNMFSCPAYVSSMKNVFVTNNVMPSKIIIPEYIKSNNLNYPLDIFDIAPLKVKIDKEPSIEGTVNIRYNMSWIFFAEEPVVARFTAPYFPPVSPAQNVILSTGEFDIGQWFRDFNLDYHIPHNVSELNFEADQPLFYTEFKTDKKIILKRFKMNKELANIAEECATSNIRYGGQKNLLQRYENAKKANLREQVLNEIKKNLID